MKNISKKKLLACLLLYMSAGANVQAANEVNLSGGSEDSILTYENTATISTSGASGDATLNWSTQQGTSLVIYDIASFTTDSDGNSSAVGYVALTNRGILNISFGDMIANYGSQIQSNSDTTRKYYSAWGYGMWVGGYSTLINDGTINTYLDLEDVDDVYWVFTRPMMAGTGSTVINNGTINITGVGGVGAQIRGMTVSAGNETLTNNGTIYINVDTSYMSRALATTGADSTLTNNGTIYNKSSTLVYGISTPNTSNETNNGTITLISNGIKSSGQIVTNADGSHMNPGALGITMQPGNADGTGVATNNGVMYIRTEATDDSNAYAITSGFNILNPTSTVGTATLINNGVIDLYSDIPASSDNNYLPTTAEITVHALTHSHAGSIVSLGNWATTLRDFSTTKDFIQARNATIDFSNTVFYLRPAANYTAGTTYDVSAESLVAPIAANSLTDANVTVQNLTSASIASEMPEFITPIYSGTSVGLYATNNVNSNEKMLSTFGLFPIDFTRLNMDKMDAVLRTSDSVGGQWFIQPYYAKMNRSDGMDGKAHGYLAGVDWKLGQRSSMGIHGSYSMNNGDDGFYNGDGSLKSWSAGLHMNFYPGETTFVRGQASYFSNEDKSTFSKTADSGITLTGTAEDSKGFYISLAAGKNLNDSLSAEINASYLNFTDSPAVNWNYMGYNLAGYKMSLADDYNAAYIGANLDWNRDISRKADLDLNLGIRGKIADEKLKLYMMNTKYSGDVEEDPFQGLISLSYNHHFTDYFGFSVGYQGVFGKDSNNNSFNAMLKGTF